MKWKFTRGRLKYSVDESFFDVWTSEMAYLLGFTYADGNIYITSLSWDLQKRDLDILEKIKNILNCTYPITFHRGKSYRLRISNQMLINGAIRRGLLPKKNLRKVLPEIPKHLMRHFVRGYLEGDGWVVLRTGRNELDIGFTGASKEFLEDLNDIISRENNITPGKVREKNKITPRGIKSVTYLLEYYSSRAYKISQWLYDNLSETDLYLNRKYMKYLDAKKLYQFLQSGHKKVREVQKREGRSIKEILDELHLEKNLNAVQIAPILGVHKSSIYRWLAESGIRYPTKRA